MCGCTASMSFKEIVPKQHPSFPSNRSTIIVDKHSKFSDYRKKYEYLSALGSGTFGKVRLYRDKESKNLSYAIKTVKKDIFNLHSIESIKREIEILRSLDHPNIVKYFETYEDDFNLHIVMEYIPGDNLFKMITNKRHMSFTERDINEIMTYLLKSVAFLHHNGIVHRDIKPDNILFSVMGKYSSLKLIDFGLSIPRNAKKEKYRVGTPYYMAPEMIEGKYCYESDMWSIGVILYILVTGRQPFKGRDQEHVFDHILAGKYDTKLLSRQVCSKELKDLIKKTLIVDTKERISVEEALKHEWFTKFTNEEINNSIISSDIILAIKNFQKQNVLHKEITYYLAKLATDNETQKLKEVFSLIDKDNSGEIEYEEIPKIFNELGIKMSEQELKNIFDSLDFHNDGKVNYTEFIAATYSTLNITSEDRIFAAFRYFDSDDTGVVTFSSVMDALKQSNIIINESGLGQIFKEYTAKGKKINFEEFKKLMTDPCNIGD